MHRITVGRCETGVGIFVGVDLPLDPEPATREVSRICREVRRKSFSDPEATYTIDLHRIEQATVAPLDRTFLRSLRCYTIMAGVVAADDETRRNSLVALGLYYTIRFTPGGAV